VSLLDSKIEVDNIPDEVGKMLRELSAIPTWTNKKHQIAASLIKLLKTKKYFFFSGNKRTYGMGSTGEHFLYRVPDNQKGNLSLYKNKRVRIICLGGSEAYGVRIYCVKAMRN
jgi:hypothetical protein